MQSMTAEPNKRLRTGHHCRPLPKEPSKRLSPQTAQVQLKHHQLIPVAPDCTRPSQTPFRGPSQCFDEGPELHNTAVSSKLPYVEPQIWACDSRTTRKSAPFRAGAKFEPL